MLGADWISIEARVKLERVGPAGLVGQSPTQARVGAQTGVTIVAVERDDEAIVSFDQDFRIEEKDVLYICGPENGIRRFHEAFPGAKLD
jgi:K+/H+ antiporter YhaU regulatory subunit KhtT